MPDSAKPEADREDKMDKVQIEKLREALVAASADLEKTLDALIRARQVTQEDLRVEFSV